MYAVLPVSLFYSGPSIHSLITFTRCCRCSHFYSRPSIHTFTICGVAGVVKRDRLRSIDQSSTRYAEQKCNDWKIPVGLVPTQVRTLHSAFFFYYYLLVVLSCTALGVAFNERNHCCAPHFFLLIHGLL